MHRAIKISLQVIYLLALCLYAICSYAGGDVFGLILCSIALGIVLHALLRVSWAFVLTTALFVLLSSYLLYAVCHVCAYPILLGAWGAVLVAGVLHQYGKREEVEFVTLLCVLFVSVLSVYKSPFLYSLHRCGKQTQVAVLEHGKWGRAEAHDGGLNIRAQYSYDALHGLIGAKRIKSVDELGGCDELWIITPTTPFTEREIRAIEHWVWRGGHVVVIADHTDLFGHARVVNQLLTGVGVKVNYDCIIDKTGDGGTYRSMTGGLRGLTACSIYGSGEVLALQPGFRERADYSKRSFFSDYMISGEEESSLYAVLMRSSYGLGCVTVFSDSTLFANFAVSRPSAQRLLRMIINARVGCSLSLLVGILGFVFLCTRGFLRRWLAVLVLLFVLGIGVIEYKTMGREIDSCVHARGDWDMVERDRAPYFTLLAASFSKCKAIPVWDGKRVHDSQVWVMGKILDLEKYRGSTLDSLPLREALSKTPEITPLDYIRSLISDSSKASFWFDEGVGLWRDLAYTYFWQDVQSSALPAIPTLGTPVSQPATVVHNGKSELGVPVLIIPVCGADGWVVVGDWVVAKRVNRGTLLIRGIWQHTSRNYGDFVLRLEEKP